jgi:protein involved in polysaccharide export with SLBB domain
MCQSLQTCVQAVTFKPEAQAKDNIAPRHLRLRFRLRWPLLALLSWILAGCAGDATNLDRSCRCDCSAQGGEIAKDYLVYCPDVLELAIESRPELSGNQTVGLDGRINLGPVGLLRVEGLSVTEIAGEIADVLNLPEDKVHARVAEYKSQQVFLFGQVAGLQHAVAYRGPERVSELLERVGGITKGAAPNKVYIVRPGIIERREPQVFHIDLKSILVDKDHRTNLRLEPYDQVFVGETKPFSLIKCIPPILRPLYETLCGLRKGADGAIRETRSEGEGMKELTR